MVALPTPPLQPGEHAYLEEIRAAEKAASKIDPDLARAALSALEYCRTSAAALMQAGAADGKQYGLLSSLQRLRGADTKGEAVTLKDTHRKAVLDIVDGVIDEASGLLQQHLSIDGVTAILHMRLVQSHARLLATMHTMKGTTEGIILARNLETIVAILSYLQPE